MHKESYNQLDSDIINALAKNKEGMRYNSIYRSLPKMPNRVSMKTFNAHLKKLVDVKIIERTETSKYCVNYKLAIRSVNARKVLDNEEFVSAEELEEIDAIHQCNKLIFELQIFEANSYYKIQEVIKNICGYLKLEAQSAYSFDCTSLSYLMIDQAAEDFRHFMRSLFTRATGEIPFTPKNPSEIKELYGDKVYNYYLRALEKKPKANAVS
jgi:DNA-binding HxlR family transcriptional regulator